MKDYILSIDLGCSNSCCCIFDEENNKYITIPNNYDDTYIFPSIVIYNNNKVYISNDAKKELEENNKVEDYFYNIKRLLGRKIDDKVIKEEIKYLTFKVINDKDNNILLQKNNNDIIYPEEIISYILTSMKNAAELYLKTKINKCIITCPTYFNSIQRNKLIDCCKISNLECINIILEPIASAVYYSYDKINKDNYNIVIYDYGSSTIDCSLININNGLIEVINTSSMSIGGIDLTNAIYNYCLEVFNMNYNIDIRNKISYENKKKLLKLCENAKILLSDRLFTYIKLENIYENKNLEIKLLREKYEDIINRLLILSIKPLNDLFININYNKEDINDVILVGLPCKTPILYKKIKDYFYNKNIITNPDLETVVCKGAALYNFILNNPNHKLVNNITLLDVTNLSIGTELNGGIYDILIKKNSIIPIETSKIYTNADEKDNIKINIYTGERSLCKDNIFLSSLILNVKPAPQGYHRIQINISIDINNIIHIKAINLKTNEEVKINIDNKISRLTEEEINKIIKDTEKYKLIDKQNKEIKLNQIELNDLIKTILNNIDNVDKLEQIKKIKEEYKNCEDINKLKEIINKLKEEYIIYLTEDKEDKIIGTLNNNMNFSSIYQDDKIDNEVNFNKNNIIDEEDDNIIKKKELEQKEINEQIEKLNNFCIEVLEFINNYDFENIDNELFKENLNNTKELTENILLDLQLNNDITLNYCKDNYNMLYDIYKQCLNNCYTIQLSKKDELKLLCNSLLKSIITDEEINNNDLYKELYNLINESLNKIETLNDIQIKEYIDKINNLCDNI